MNRQLSAEAQQRLKDYQEQLKYLADSTPQHIRIAFCTKYQRHINSINSYFKGEGQDLLLSEVLLKHIQS